MTTEEKAKAYDEAIKRAKPLMLDTNFSMKNTVISIFPELKENEDEKIREELIDHCKKLVRMVQDNKVMLSVYEPWLAYLEKQKAKERLDRMAPIYNDKESFESALEKAWKYYNESASRTVDSFEDDYIECVFSKGFREGFLYKENQKEQKPREWGKEDEEMLEDIKFNFIYNKEKMTDALIAQYNRFFDKIKSLKPQPKQEWSEEDEDFINMLILHFNYLINKGGDSVETYKSYIEKLKSLRPPFKDKDMKLKILKYLSTRCSSLEFEEVEDYLNNLCPSWKPSEEQMETLNEAVGSFRMEDTASCEKIADTLESLYNDLQKLL